MKNACSLSIKKSNFYFSIHKLGVIYNHFVSPTHSINNKMEKSILFFNETTTSSINRLKLKWYWAPENNLKRCSLGQTSQEVRPV